MRHLLLCLQRLFAVGICAVDLWLEKGALKLVVILDGVLSGDCLFGLPMLELPVALVHESLIGFYSMVCGSLSGFLDLMGD